MSHLPLQDVTPVLGAPISRMGLEETLDFCKKEIDAGRGGPVYFVNTHVLVESQRLPALKQALEQAKLACADGRPLVWASQLKGLPVRSQVAGPSFSELFLRHFPELPMGFVSGDSQIGPKIEKRFKLRHITAFVPPFREFSEKAALEDWESFLKLCPSEVPPPAIFVGLGAPKQELWIKAVAARAPGSLFFGVGAALDLLAEKRKRAPVWMQKAGMEWSYRLAQEPRRLLSRYLKSNTAFVLLLAKDLLGRRL